MTQKKKILVIDDEEDFSFFTQRNLERSDYDVFLATDGETGIAMARKLKPDLILLDILMPGIDGFTTLERLKADPETTLIHVVMLTGKDDEDSRMKATQLRDADYIVKPVEIEELRSRIEKVFEPPSA